MKGKLDWSRFHLQCVERGDYLPRKSNWNDAVIPEDVLFLGLSGVQVKSQKS